MNKCWTAPPWARIHDHSFGEAIRLKRDRNQRRGAVAVLVAVLMIPLFAMVAFAIDIGYVAHVKSELQKAADAAALAGAAKLMTPQYTGVTTSSTTADANIALAKAEAQK